MVAEERRHPRRPSASSTVRNSAQESGHALSTRQDGRGLGGSARPRETRRTHSLAWYAIAATGTRQTTPDANQGQRRRSQPEDASLAAPLILGTVIDPRPGGLARPIP